MSLPDSDRHRLADALQRRALSHDEEAELEAHLARNPAERPEWEQERALADLLRQVPDVPLSTNFTARVLEIVRKEERPAARARGAWTRWLTAGWLPRLTALTAVLCLSLLSYHHYQVSSRQEAARTVAEMLRSGTTLDVLQDFDAIQRLNQVPPKHDADKELIAALQ